MPAWRFECLVRERSCAPRSQRWPPGGCFKFHLRHAAILGAALASTDPVLLRGLLRRPDISPETRQALRLESGLNDVVLLPIVVVAIALTGHHYQDVR